MGRKRKENEQEAKPRFHSGMVILDVLEKEPRAEKVLLEFGLPCHRCIVAESETLADGCGPLGLKVDEVLARLNGFEEGDVG